MFAYCVQWQKRKHILSFARVYFFMVSKEIKEIRGSICDYHMDYSARKIYQLSNLQFLVLNLIYELWFSSYEWKSLSI